MEGSEKECVFMDLEKMIIEVCVCERCSVGPAHQTEQGFGGSKTHSSSALSCLEVTIKGSGNFVGNFRTKRNIWLFYPPPCFHHPTFSLDLQMSVFRHR